jgi:hypothetical protein
VRDDEGQQPVTQPPARVVDRTVGHRTDDAVDHQPALLLEPSHGSSGRFVVDEVIALFQQTEPLELPDDLGNRLTAVADSVDALGGCHQCSLLRCGGRRSLAGPPLSSVSAQPVLDLTE